MKLWQVLVLGEGFRVANAKRDFQLTGVVEAVDPNDAFNRVCALALNLHPELAQATGPLPRPVINADEIQEVRRRDVVEVDVLNFDWVLSSTQS